MTSSAYGQIEAGGVSSDTLPPGTHGMLVRD